MRVLLTGADGFVGKHVRLAATSAGHDVVSISGPASSVTTGGHRLDIRDSSQVNLLLSRIGSSIDVVLHLAGQSSVHRSWNDPGETVAINTVGTLNMWKASLQWRVPHFIFVSSSEVYGTNAKRGVLLPEDTPISPVNPYGISKATAEAVLSLTAANTQTCLTILRTFNHIGPGQDSSFVVPTFVQQLAAVRTHAAPVIHVGNLGAVRDFLDVRDVAKAYVRVIESPPSANGVFNLCSGVPRSIESLLAALVRESGIAHLKIEPDANRMRPVEVPEMVGDASRFRDRFGWRPEIPWEETICSAYRSPTDI